MCRMCWVFAQCATYAMLNRLVSSKITLETGLTYRKFGSCIGVKFIAHNRAEIWGSKGGLRPSHISSWKRISLTLVNVSLTVVTKV